MGLGKTLQSIALLAYLKSARSSKGPFCKLASTICPTLFCHFISFSSSPFTTIIVVTWHSFSFKPPGALLILRKLLIFMKVLWQW